jgi:hypothetical protein
MKALLAAGKVDEAEKNVLEHEAKGHFVGDMVYCLLIRNFAKSSSGTDELTHYVSELRKRLAQFREQNNSKIGLAIVSEYLNRKDVNLAYETYKNNPKLERDPLVIGMLLVAYRVTFFVDLY